MEHPRALAKCKKRRFSIFNRPLRQAVACTVGCEVGVTAVVHSLRIGGVGIPEGFLVAVLQVVGLQAALGIEISPSELPHRRVADLCI